MLAELSIDDLVLIERARLELSPGLNVITGETGAGKSLLAQAIGLLMGQKGGEELVRPGAARALVQALFEPPDEDAEALAVAREVPRGGRSRARMNGLLSSAAAVEDSLRERLAFYGQLEHTRLLQLERQLDLLDAFADAEVGPRQAAYAEAYESARGLVRELEGLRAAGRERERELDMLRFQVDEIDAAGIEPGEDKRLVRERERLRHAGRLLERVGGALSLLAGESESAALDGVRVGQRLIGEAAALDAGLAATAARLDGLAAELDDVAAVLRAYLDDLDVDPAHRDALEVRYDRLRGLQRKYGATADEILEYAEKGRARIELLEEFEANEEALTRAAAAARDEALRAAAALSAARAEAAPAFAARVVEELRRLAMPHARFEVRLAPRGALGAAASREAAAGTPPAAEAAPDELAGRFAALGPRGADDVEFLFGANPGVPLRPLRETASGGELSRAMLAIRGIVTLGDDVETLIFDVVDAGIGGVTAAALGERLAALAEGRQIVCITHLPQVAAYADRQFAITKVSDAEAGVTRTEVRQIEGEERLAELCRMLGAGPDDAAARRHAEGLLARAGAGAT
jgi:DNA repair protein RecN (Recombination protein N)